MKVGDFDIHRIGCRIGIVGVSGDADTGQSWIEFHLMVADDVVARIEQKCDEPMFVSGHWCNPIESGLRRRACCGEVRPSGIDGRVGYVVVDFPIDAVCLARGEVGGAVVAATTVIVNHALKHFVKCDVVINCNHGAVNV